MAVFSAIAARKARKQQISAQEKLDQQIAGRQDIINPYENVSDLSGMISNPFANLQVSTAAAEMQAEQADISLANTLDTLRSTGAGAAGATALAQAALQSKRGVAATIQQQEAQNTRLRAQGQQQAEQRRMAEAEKTMQLTVEVLTRKWCARRRHSHPPRSRNLYRRIEICATIYTSQLAVVVYQHEGGSRHFSSSSAGSS